MEGRREGLGVHHTGALEVNGQPSSGRAILPPNAVVANDEISFAIEPAAHVRTLAMVELLFAYAVSLKLFRERFSALELWGIAFISAGVILITLLH